MEMKTYFHIVELKFADNTTDILVLESESQSNVRAANAVWRGLAGSDEKQPYEITAERAKKSEAIDAIANGARDWTMGN